jgi:hypothetical protein
MFALDVDILTIRIVLMSLFLAFVFLVYILCMWDYIGCLVRIENILQCAVA